MVVDNNELFPSILVVITNVEPVKQGPRVTRGPWNIIKQI